MTMANPLIRPKLRLPFTRPDLVARPRLEEQIAQGLRGPLTLITAPAGFGKTTLVASCIVGCECPVAWLSLDQDDNREGRFLNYMIAALREIDHTLGSEAAQFMAASQQAVSEVVLTSLVNDLDAVGREMFPGAGRLSRHQQSGCALRSRLLARTLPPNFPSGNRQPLRPPAAFGAPARAWPDG
ncbi:MAG: hypothetical protein KC547_14510 [Anaerolineae bacterium]|nr:hypothetical protein [Anaerolineae bacterium]